MDIDHTVIIDIILGETRYRCTRCTYKLKAAVSGAGCDRVRDAGCRLQSIIVTQLGIRYRIGATLGDRAASAVNKRG